MADRLPLVQNAGELQQLQSGDVLTDVVYAAAGFGINEVLVQSDGTGKDVKATGIATATVVTASSTFATANAVIAADSGGGRSTKSAESSAGIAEAFPNSLRVTRSSDDTNPPTIIFRKSRGTVGSEADVQNGDSIGNFPFVAYRNGGYQATLAPASGYFEARVTGTVSGDSVPTSIVFQVTRPGDTVNSSCVVFWQNQSLIVGGTAAAPSAGDRGVIVITRFDDTDPTPSANTAGLKSKNVDSSAELFAWNEAGDVFQLTGDESLSPVLGSWNMLLWFRFDEGTGTTLTDRSTYGSDGTLSAAPPNWGTDFVQLDDASTDDFTVTSTSRLELTDGFTIHARLAILNTSGTSSILVKTSTGSWDDGWGFYLSSGGALVFFIDDWSTGDTVSYAWTTGATIRDVCIVCDNTNLFLYVDGVLENSTTTTGTTATSADIDTLLGSSGGDTPGVRWYDLKIFDKPATYKDVQRLHADPL